MHFSRRLTPVAVLLAGATALAGCASPASLGASGASLGEICADPLVTSCDVAGESALVVIAAGTSDDEVIALAGRTFYAASSSTSSVRLQSEAEDPLVLDPEVSPPFAWQIDVTPADRNAFDERLREILDCADVPGTTGISVIDGWPSATVDDVELFVAVFDRLSSTPLFERGGTYTLQSLDEHLRVVHVADRTSDAAIHEIIGIARDYPDAEVLLEAPTAGPQHPTLYISRLTPPQVLEVDARLRDPALADADIDGLPLEFVLGSLGEQGVTYVSGTFGDVAAG
nr:hypothetical protein [uncultured Microbacterium sp.]